MINLQIKDGIHWLEINEAWNWVVCRKLEPLTENATQLVITLTHCQFLDSEAIILIWKWLNSKKKLKLINVPDIYFEIIEILELKDQFKDIKISVV
jgi:hypothetical protein